MQQVRKDANGFLSVCLCVSVLKGLTVQERERDGKWPTFLLLYVYLLLREFALPWLRFIWSEGNPQTLHSHFYVCILISPVVIGSISIAYTYFLFLLSTLCLSSFDRGMFNMKPVSLAFLKLYKWQCCRVLQNCTKRCKVASPSWLMGHHFNSPTLLWSK